ncbi:stage III sporulation protein AB [Acidaminobacterium chupaoyuni]
MKVIGALMVLLSCSWAGCASAKEIAARARELNVLISAMGILKSEILFHHATMEQCLKRAVLQSSGRTQEFFEKIYDALLKNPAEPFAVLWKNGAAPLQPFFGRNAALAVEELSGVLGCYDGPLQAERIDKCIEILENERSKAENSLKTTGKLYKTAGVSMGVAAALLIL